MVDISLQAVARVVMCAPKRRLFCFPPTLCSSHKFVRVFRMPNVLAPGIDSAQGAGPLYTTARLAAVSFFCSIGKQEKSPAGGCACGGLDSKSSRRYGTRSRSSSTFGEQEKVTLTLLLSRLCSEATALAGVAVATAEAKKRPTARRSSAPKTALKPGGSFKGSGAAGTDVAPET